MIAKAGITKSLPSFLAKNQTPTIIGKNLNVATRVSGETTLTPLKPCSPKLAACMKMTETIAIGTPKKTPAIGAKRSKTVNLTLAPSRALMGICRRKPRI